MRCACAGELGRIFLRLHERDRIGADVGFAACPLNRLAQVGRRRSGVECDGDALPAQVLDKREEGVGLEHVCMAAEALAARRRELPSVEKHDRTPLKRQITPAERQRRVGYVRAANIEQPRQIVRIADQKAARRPHGLTHARDFRRAAFPRESQLMGHDRAQWSGRPIRPDCVNRVGVDRNQPGARLLAGGRESRHGVRRMKSRVVPELVTLLELTRDPFARRLVGDMAKFEYRWVRLGLHLRRVSAVDE